MKFIQRLHSGFGKLCCRTREISTGVKLICTRQFSRTSKMPEILAENEITDHLLLILENSVACGIATKIDNAKIYGIHWWQHWSLVVNKLAALIKIAGARWEESRSSRTEKNIDVFAFSFLACSQQCNNDYECTKKNTIQPIYGFNSHCTYKYMHTDRCPSLKYKKGITLDANKAKDIFFLTEWRLR